MHLCLYNDWSLPLDIHDFSKLNLAIISVYDIIKITNKEDLMAEVRIEKKEDFEKAMKKFKIQCKREGILKEFKERQYYTKPSQKRRKTSKKKKR